MTTNYQVIVTLPTSDRFSSKHDIFSHGSPEIVRLHDLYAKLHELLWYSQGEVSIYCISSL